MLFATAREGDGAEPFAVGGLTTCAALKGGVRIASASEGEKGCCEVVEVAEKGVGNGLW